MDNSRKPDEFGSLSDFITLLESISWFSRIGTMPSGVECIHDWADWPGPEEDSVNKLCEEQQEIFDSFCTELGKLPDDLDETWNRIQGMVIDRASMGVLYDPNEDAWHGPTSAVWSAAWTASLIALHIQCKRRISSSLVRQWDWYKKGHWPWGYSSALSDQEQPEFVVF